MKVLFTFFSSIQMQNFEMLLARTMALLGLIAFTLEATVEILAIPPESWAQRFIAISLALSFSYLYDEYSDRIIMYCFRRSGMNC